MGWVIHVGMGVKERVYKSFCLDGRADGRTEGLAE